MTGASQQETERAEGFRRVLGDADAMRAWLNVSLPTVYAFVFARCGADELVAQDVTQETMVEVVRHRADFDGRSEPRDLGVQHRTPQACGSLPGEVPGRAEAVAAHEVRP